MSLQYKKVKKSILEDLKLLHPNQKIKSRTQYCEELMVARATVTKAINELVDEGVLYSVSGSGTFLSPIGMRDTAMSWAVILPDVLSEVYPRIISGIYRLIADKNINIILCNSGNNPIKQNQYIEKIVKIDIAGCIIIPIIDSPQNYETYKMLVKSKIPCVFCNRIVEGFHTVPVVINNNYYGAYIATRTLIKNNCKKLAYISSENYNVSIQRFSGFKAAIYETDGPVSTQHIFFEDSMQIFEEKVFEMFSQEERPDGILCFNDKIALIVYKVLHNLKIKIGTEIKIIGYDNTDVCDAITPKLTSVSLESEEIGYQAASMLYNNIVSGSEKLEKLVIVKPHIVFRESCPE